MSEYDRDTCMVLLQRKYEEIKAQGRTDYPKRADFPDNEVIAIKSFLGPWPRALEAAGIKPVNEELMEKKRQIRIARKRKKTQKKIAARQQRKQEAATSAAEQKNGGPADE